MKKIQRTEIRNKAQKRTTLTQVDNDFCLAQVELKYRADEEWRPASSTSWADGKEVHNGKVTRIQNTERYFELLVKYEGFQYVEEQV